MQIVLRVLRPICQALPGSIALLLAMIPAFFLPGTIQARTLRMQGAIDDPLPPITQPKLPDLPIWDDPPKWPDLPVIPTPQLPDEPIFSYPPRLPGQIKLPDLPIFSPEPRLPGFLEQAARHLHHLRFHHKHIGR